MKRWVLNASKDCGYEPQYYDAEKRIEIGTWAVMVESESSEPCVAEWPNDCDYVRWDDAAALEIERDQLRRQVTELQTECDQLKAKLAKYSQTSD